MLLIFFTLQSFKRKLHYFDLLWICCTTSYTKHITADPQYLDVPLDL